MILNGANFASGRIANRRPFHMAGMGDYTPTSTGGDTTTQDITQMVHDLAALYNQQQILETNLELARLGRPPINTAAIAPTYNVGLSPDAKNLLLIGGAALLFVMLMNGNRRGRR
ncbi:MAG TPA: hypothetical protein VJ577_11385 [Burkholderiaceae bacterium]|nr:hypothetical protein [Burkholderiaceae bacterium]